MKLNAKQVNKLKAIIQGNSLESLYNRLQWDTPKIIRLNIIEKDALQEIIDSPYNDDEDRILINELIKDKRKRK